MPTHAAGRVFVAPSIDAAVSQFRKKAAADLSYAVEAHYILELYKKTRKYTPRQGLKKAQEVFDEAREAQR